LSLVISSLFSCSWLAWLAWLSTFAKYTNLFLLC
jgi:hypothetical protein